MAFESGIHLNVPQAAFQEVKVLFFDLMGTCLDWHTSIVDALLHVSHVPSSDSSAPAENGQSSPQSRFALRWRQGFFDEIHARFESGKEPEDIDVTHRRVLDRLLDADGAAGGGPSWSEAQRQTAVDAWHGMRAWPDVGPALKRLRAKYQVFVLANGTTKLQLDLMRSSGLEFDMLFSSQLLGLTKPDRRMYERAVELVGGGGLKAEECVMVAAHAYDLRAARQVGMKTMYVQRWTEDGQEDMEVVKGECDGFVDGRGGEEICGLARVADLLGVCERGQLLHSIEGQSSDGL
jgi:2-haloalkanoic acid dehalogenase type II